MYLHVSVYIIFCIIRCIIYIRSTILNSIPTAIEHRNTVHSLCPGDTHAYAQVYLIKESYYTETLLANKKQYIRRLLRLMYLTYIMGWLSNEKDTIGEMF